MLDHGSVLHYLITWLGSTLFAEIFDPEIAVLVRSIFALQAEIAPLQRVRGVGGGDQLAVQANFNS